MTKTSLALLLLFLATFSLFAQKQQTDREFRGFKGPVKSVTVERATLIQADGKSVEVQRQTQTMLTFDAEGNLVTDKAYNAGQEFDLRTYSFIDGERVVKHDILNRSLGGGIGTGEQPSRPQDPRYSAKIKYKYDNQGNRTEMAWIRPDGVTSLRHVYKVNGNRREVSVYRHDGSFSHGWTDVVDDKGNVIETANVLPGSNRQANAASKYTYLEFDSQGNWTKRTETRGDTTRVSYRTITYH